MNFKTLKESDYSVKLLKCHKCLHVTDNCPEAHSDFSHCFNCVCSTPDCKETWFICTKHYKRFCRNKICQMNEHFSIVDHNEDKPDHLLYNKMCSNRIGASVDKSHKDPVDVMHKNLIQTQKESRLHSKRPKHKHVRNDDLSQIFFSQIFPSPS